MPTRKYVHTNHREIALEPREPPNLFPRPRRAHVYIDKHLSAVTHPSPPVVAAPQPAETTLASAAKPEMVGNSAPCVLSFGHHLPSSAPVCTGGIYASSHYSFL